MTLFYVFAAVAVMASLLVIAQRNPIYSVLLLIASFGALSGLYVLLDAPFVAVTQIIVYAGAIMVLFLFVVMLLNAPHEETDYDEKRASAAASGPDAVWRRCSRWPWSSSSLWALTKSGGETGALSRPRPSARCAPSGGRCSPNYAFRVRSDVGADPRRHGRRRRARAA